MRPTRNRDNVMPIGHCIIKLEEVSSFVGNKDLNSLDAILDELFKAVVTISIENQEKKYSVNEKQLLVNEIQEQLKKGEQQ